MLSFVFSWWTLIGAAAGIQSLPYKMLDCPSRAHAPANATLSSSSSSLGTCWSLFILRVHYFIFCFLKMLKMCDLWRPTSNIDFEVISKCMSLNYFHKTPCRDSWGTYFCFLFFANTQYNQPDSYQTPILYFQNNLSDQPHLLGKAKPGNGDRKDRSHDVRNKCHKIAIYCSNVRSANSHLKQ